MANIAQGERRGAKNTQQPILPNGQMKDSLGFTPFEELLIEWSVSTVGRNWNIIADILRVYPLTSEQQRDASKITEQYVSIKMRKGKFFHKNMRLDPTEDDGIQILGRFKPYLLMNRMFPIYPQRYAVVYDCPSNKKPEEEKHKGTPKLAGKRKMLASGLPSDYEMREIKYKRKYEMNPIPFLTKNGQLNLSISSGSGTCTPGRRPSSFSINTLIASNQYSIISFLTSKTLHK